MTILCNGWKCVFNREGICTYEVYMYAGLCGEFYIDEDGKCLRRAHKEKEKEKADKDDQRGGKLNG